MGHFTFGVVVGAVVSAARQAQRLRRLEAAVDRVATIAPPYLLRSPNRSVLSVVPRFQGRILRDQRAGHDG